MRLVGSGGCEDFNNIPECNYDGGKLQQISWFVLKNRERLYSPGDCCGVTVVKDNCDICECIDPDHPMFNTTQWESCKSLGGLVKQISNGICNDFNNIPECHYDGGELLCT